MAQTNDQVVELAGEPTAHELEALMKEKGMMAVAEQFGLSLGELDGIRKKYGIVLVAGDVLNQKEKPHKQYDVNHLLFTGEGFKFLFFSFQGRLTRSGYWYGLLFAFIQYAIIMFLAIGAIRASKGLQGLAIVLGILVVAEIVIFLIQSLAIYIKRAHDRDKSGHFIWVSLIPLIGVCWMGIELGFLESKSKINEYGPKSTIPGGSKYV